MDKIYIIEFMDLDGYTTLDDEFYIDKDKLISHLKSELGYEDLEDFFVNVESEKLAFIVEKTMKNL